MSGGEERVRGSERLVGRRKLSSVLFSLIDIIPVVEETTYIGVYLSSCSASTTLLVTFIAYWATGARWNDEKKEVP